MSEHAEQEEGCSVPIWTQLHMQTAIEIALCVAAREVPDAWLDHYSGISPWIQAATTDFEKQHAGVDWALRGEYYEAVEDWTIARIVAQRMEAP